MTLYTPIVEGKARASLRMSALLTSSISPIVTSLVGKQINAQCDRFVVLCSNVKAERERLMFVDEALVNQHPTGVKSVQVSKPNARD